MAPDFGFENNPSLLDEVKDFFKGDRFAHNACGAEVVAVGTEQAVVSMPINDSVLNARGVVQGGALFTLADLAGGVADYLPGQMNTTVDATIQYLKPAQGSMLYAHAHATRRGRNIGYYRVDVTDDLGTNVAAGQFTFMHWSA